MATPPQPGPDRSWAVLFGAALQRLRLRLRPAPAVTPDELGQRVGVDGAMVQAVERGALRPDAEFVARCERELAAGGILQAMLPFVHVEWDQRPPAAPGQTGGAARPPASVDPQPMAPDEITDEITVEFQLGPDLRGEHAELLTLLAVALLQQGGSVTYRDEDFEEVVGSVDGVAVVSDLRTMATTLQVTYVPPDAEPATLRAGKDPAVITNDQAMVAYHIGPTGEGPQAQLLTILAIVLHKQGGTITFDARDTGQIGTTVRGIINRFNPRTQTSTLHVTQVR